MNNRLIETIKQYVYLLNSPKPDYEEFYKHIDLESRSEVSQFLIETCKLNPLIHMTSIPDNFLKSSSITEIDIPNNITSIGEYAFCTCKKLTDTEISSSVSSIDFSAFLGCIALTKVNYTDTMDQWVRIYFANSLSNPLNYAKNFYINNQLVTEANITTATKISNYAFYGCTSLTRVTMGNSVTSIGKSAFDSCSKLKSVTIGNGVISIDDSAFDGCTDLEKVVIGSSVADIGNNAFFGCNLLKNVSYISTVDDWKKLKIANNSFDKGAVIHCKDGDVRL